MSPRGAMIFFGIFMAVGLMALGFGAMLFLDVQEVKGWPSTTGVVEQTWIDERYDSGGRGQSSHYDYTPGVQYSYQVDGVTYYSSQVAKMQSAYSSYAGAQGYIEQHSVGSPVTVYYDPAHPDDAVLEKNSDTESLVLPGLGALFTAIGAVGLVHFYRRWRS